MEEVAPIADNKFEIGSVCVCVPGFNNNPTSNSYGGDGYVDGLMGKITMTGTGFYAGKIPYFPFNNGFGVWGMTLRYATKYEIEAYDRGIENIRVLDAVLPDLQNTDAYFKYVLPDLQKMYGVEISKEYTVKYVNYLGVDVTTIISGTSENDAISKIADASSVIYVIG